jgi:hypothetical protein
VEVSYLPPGEKAKYTSIPEEWNELEDIIDSEDSDE